MASVTAVSALCILLCSVHGVVTAYGQELPLHLTYYVQEYQGGPNNTLLSAAGTGQGNLSAIGWGTFLVLDNLLKAGPNESSQLLGSVTGSAVVTTRSGVARGDGIQINTQHIFKDGSPYNGSRLTVIGTISTASPPPPWEVNVPGGTGAFRGYSGYALLTPLTDNFVPPFYVYQWDVYISFK